MSRAPVPESELLQKMEPFADAQDAVNELRRRGFLADGADGVLTLTDAAHVAHARAAACVAIIQRAVSAALPGENYATLTRLLADLVNGLDQTSRSSR